MPSRTIFLFLVLVNLFLAGYAQTANENKPASSSLLHGKGKLSFKVNGTNYRSDSTQTKCWTSTNVPLAILWARSETISISWQIQDFHSKGTYRIDNDKKGKINFTINGTTYWIRKTDGTNYLNITVTGTRDKFSVKLLSGSFEGVAEDKDGNKIHITNGVFITEDI